MTSKEGHYWLEQTHQRDHSLLHAGMYKLMQYTKVKLNFVNVTMIHVIGILLSLALDMPFDYFNISSDVVMVT